MIPEWIISAIANAEGVTPAQLKTIEDAIPAVQELLTIVQQAMPLANQALPLVKQITPAAQIILAVLAKQRGTSNETSSVGNKPGGAIG
jgi:hypothetical protein